jgi:hypothetical protein
MKCELLNNQLDRDRLVEFFIKTFIPLVTEFWEERGRAYYGVPAWSPTMAQGLLEMVDRHALVLLVCRDDSDAPCGMVFGTPVTHLMTGRTNFLVELWYGRTREAEELMFEKLREGLGFAAAEQVVVPRYEGVPVPAAAEGILNPRPDKIYMCRGV